MLEAVSFLRSERPYRRLLSASVLSGIGDWFNSVALLSLLLHLTGSGLSVGITLAMRTVPYLVIGPIGGYLVDHMNRKTILLVSDFARAVLALSFLFIHSEGEVWIAYVGTLALVVFSAMFSPARTAVIPQLVQQDRVTQANSLEQSTLGLSMAMGSALGGIVTASFGTDSAFVINALSFLASGLISWSIHFSNDHLSVSHPSPRSFRTRSESFFSLVFRRSRLIQIVALQSLLWPIGGGVINVLLSVYGYQVFHDGNTAVGILYGALGLGFVISGFIAHRFTKWMRGAVVIGCLLEGLCHVLVSQSPDLWVASTFLVIATIGSGVCNAGITSLTMQNVSKEFHGRVFALFDTMSSMTIAFSMMGAGVLLNHLPARTLGFDAGWLMVIMSIVTGIPLLGTKLPIGIGQAID